MAQIVLEGLSVEERVKLLEAWVIAHEVRLNAARAHVGLPPEYYPPEKEEAKA